MQKLYIKYLCKVIVIKSFCTENMIHGTLLLISNVITVNRQNFGHTHKVYVLDSKYYQINNYL